VWGRMLCHKQECSYFPLYLSGMARTRPVEACGQGGRIYDHDTTWTLDKEQTPPAGPLTGDGTIDWDVTATCGATSDKFLIVNGVITVTNTGRANATIGNIVVNLQKRQHFDRCRRGKGPHRALPRHQ
jgi:hypothetical protein